MATGPFSRVYHQLADEYPELYDSPDLAGYVRLLVAADQAWPTAARWAGLASRAETQRLAQTGLVVLDGPRYRIKGLDKERQARSDAGKYAVNTRWDRVRNTDRSTPRSTDSIPSREENSKDEKRRDEHNARASLDNGQEGLPHLTPEVQRRIEAIAGVLVSTASDRVLTELDVLVERHGDEAVAQAMGRIKADSNVPPRWPQLVYGARNRLEPIAGAPDAKSEQEREREEAERRRWQRASEVNRRRREELFGETA